MKKNLAFACLASLAALALFAQDEDLGLKLPEKPKAKWFSTLPFCRRVEGGGEVRMPDSSNWVAIEEGRFYPFGSSYRAGEKGVVVMAFGKECNATIQNGASFSTRAQIVSVPSRTIVLTGGAVELSLPSNLDPELFFVTTPAFTIKNLAGDSHYQYRERSDGFEADIRCVTGMMEVEGRHFTIPEMHAADAFTLRSEHDHLETIMYGRSGDFIAKLDRGLVTREEIQDDGTVKNVVEPGVLDWHLSVATRVQINRAVPSIGSRLSVTMMTFDSAGEMKNHFAFTEGRSEVNSGELVINPKSSEEVAKKAAEVTNEAAAEATEEAAVEDSDESGSSSAPAAKADSDDDF